MDTKNHFKKDNNMHLDTASIFRPEHSLRICFITDNHIPHKITHDTLIEFGHHVDDFPHVKEALPQVLSGEYDLMLITVGKDATIKECVQLLDFIRQQEKPEIYGISLVVLTELNSPAILETLFIAGSSDVIVHPVNKTELHRRLYQVIFLVPESIFKGRQKNKVHQKNKVTVETSKKNTPGRRSKMAPWYAVFSIAVIIIVSYLIYTKGINQGIERTKITEQLANKQPIERIEPEQQIVPKPVREQTVIKPAMEQPKIATPVVVKPVIEQPKIATPVVVKPMIEQPEIATPVVVKPVIEQSTVVKQAAVPVSVMLPELGDMIKKIELSGQVVSDDKLIVNSEIRGKVANVLVQEGELVAANQVIVIMDNNEAKAALKKAQTRFNETKKSSRAEAAKYKTRLKMAGLLSSSKLNDRRLNKAEAANNDAIVALKIATDELSYARSYLKNLTIAAKFEGFISSLYAQKSRIINEGDPLFILASTPLLIEVDFELTQNPDVVVGDAVTVFTHKNRRKSTFWNENIMAVKPIRDNSNKTSKWRVRLTATKKQLRYDQKIYIDLPIIKKTAVIKVPVDSIIKTKNKNFLPIYVDGVIKYQAVVLGVRVGNHVEIKKGLKLDDKIIISQKFIKEGTPVSVN